MIIHTLTQALVVAFLILATDAWLRGGILAITQPFHEIGQIFTGAEAKKKKLVDELGYIEDAYALAKKLGGSPDAAVVRYQRHSSLTEIFGILGQTKAGQGKLNIDISDRLLPRLDAGHMYLLPSHMIP
jgi:protease-4